MSLEREQQQVALRNAAQDSFQFTLSKQDVSGGIEDIINILCVRDENELLLGYLSLPNLPYTLMNGTNISTSQQQNGRRTKILCIGMGYSQQLRQQWLSIDSPIESALVNVRPPSAMILPALNDFTYPT